MQRKNESSAWSVSPLRLSWKYDEGTLVNMGIDQESSREARMNYLGREFPTIRFHRKQVPRNSLILVRTHVLSLQTSF